MSRIKDPKKVADLMADIEAVRTGGSARSRITQRRIARVLGVSRSWIWRAKLIASLPKDVFDALVDSDEPPTPRQLADLARVYRGDVIPEDYECCPHCGEPIRRRG